MTLKTIKATKKGSVYEIEYRDDTQTPPAVIVQRGNYPSLKQKYDNFTKDTDMDEGPIVRREVKQ